MTETKKMDRRSFIKKAGAGAGVAAAATVAAPAIVQAKDRNGHRFHMAA